MASDTHNVIHGGFFFSAVIQGRNITVQLPPQVHAALDGLPPLSATFTGRELALKRVLEVLDPANHTTDRVQVSVVTGLAGVGKTELALQAAHCALKSGWFPGGVLFVDMFGYDPQRKLEPAIALDGLLRAAGIPGEHIPATEQDRSRLLSSVLAAYAAHRREVLVVVDNAASSAQAQPLLPGRGTAVVTSRHTLADLEARLTELDVLTPDAAVNLLAKRLSLALGADRRVEDHPSDAKRIAELCGQLPLALHIVAAHLAEDPVRPLAAMAADLRDASTRLHEISYGTVAVQAAFDLSYRHLDPAHARLFRLIPVNPGPEVSTAAAAVLAALTSTEARKLLEDLARAHLIDHGSAYGRWRMHDLIRLYAEQHGQACVLPDRPAEALTRLLEYYQRTAEAACAHLDATIVDPAATGPPNGVKALDWMDAEYSNLTAAVHAAAASRDHLGFARDLSSALWDFLCWGRYFDDWVALAEAALTAAGQLHDRPGEADALNSLGQALVEVRRFDEAVSACRDAVAVYRETGDQQGEAEALNSLGIALREARRFDEAFTACQDAIAVFRETGDRRGEVAALHNLGNVLEEVRQFDEAIATYEQVLKICRETCDRHSEASALMGLGQALDDVRRFDEAISAYQEAAVICHQLGDQYREAAILDSLGVPLREVRRFDEAVQACSDAVAIYREFGDRHGEATALVNLGPALNGARRLDEAVGACRDAADIFREIGDRHSQAMALGNLAKALRDVRRLDEALSACQDAVAIFRQVGDQKDGEALAMNNLGAVLLAVRRFDEAINACQDAIAIYRQLDDRHGEATAMRNLGTALVKKRRVRDAFKVFKRAIEIEEELATQESRALTVSPRDIP